MQPLEFFAGVDWSSKEHQVCVLDLEGKVCGQRGFAHCGKGLHEMIDWIVNTTGAPAEKVGVVIETPRGPVVESLLGRGFVVHSINPKQMDRYRGPFQCRRSQGMIAWMRGCWPRLHVWTAVICERSMPRCRK